MRVRFTFSTHVAILEICISFFHVLYLSVSKTAGEMYTEAIALFNSATNVNLKIMEQNITKPQNQQIYRERIFICSPVTTTLFTIKMSHNFRLEAASPPGVFKEDYTTGLAHHTV